MKTRKTEHLPGTKCDLCKKEGLTTIIDAPTRMGPWAHMCEPCYKEQSTEPATKFTYQERKHEPAYKPGTMGAVLEAKEKRRRIVEFAEGLSVEQIEHMMMDGDVEAADGCVVDPDGSCCHGYPSPLLTLGMI